MREAANPRGHMDRRVTRVFSFHAQSLCRFFSAVILLLLVSACGWFDDPVKKAADHLAKGNFAAARIEATNAIQKDENNAEAYLLLGRALLNQGEFATADGALKRAAALGMEPSRLDAFRTRALLKLRAYDRILEELRPGPGHQGELLALVLAARGLAHSAMSQRAEARSSFQAALKIVPELPEARIGQAQLAFSEKNYDEAMLLVEQVIARSPKHAGAWELKGMLLQSQGKPHKALEAFKQAASNDRTSLEARIAAAELSMTLKQFDAAQNYIHEARERFPDAIIVWHMQALLHFEQKQYDEALNQLQAVFNAQPNAVPSIALAGAAHLAQGEIGQAEERFRTVLRAQPDHVLARRLYAASLLRQGKAKEALDILQPALDNTSGDPKLLTLIAEAHIRMREFAKATAYFEKAAELSTDHADALTRLGVAKIAGGQAAEGLATLEKAAALSSDDVSAATVLATILLKRGDAKKALAAAQNIQFRAPHNPIGFSLAGVALLKLNDSHAARANFERAAEIDPGFWPAAAQLARLDLAAGKRDAARARIERALAKDANNIQSMAALMEITGDRGQFINLLETARQADPKAIAPRLVLAREYLARGLADRALPVAREVLAAAPGKPEATELLGTAQLAAGHHNEALTTFRELASRMPESALAQSRLGAALAAMGDVRGAETAYRKAMVLQPGDTGVAIGLAQLYQRENRLDDALKLASELQRNHPKLSIGHLLAGDLYLSAGRYSDAIKAYDDAFKRAPSARTLVSRHIARARAGNKPEDADLVQWLRENPNDLTVRMHLADLRYIEGHYLKAAEHYEWIVRSDPNRSIAWNNLASTYLKLKDPRALAAAEAAHKLKPDDGSILDTLGVAQTHYGKVDIAVDTLKKAISRRPDSADTRINYALALAKAGDGAGARAELRKVVSSDNTVVLGEEAKAVLQAR